jgi:hypothetical protein
MKTNIGIAIITYRAAIADRIADAAAICRARPVLV